MLQFSRHDVISIHRFDFDSLRRFVYALKTPFIIIYPVNLNLKMFIFLKNQAFKTKNFVLLKKKKLTFQMRAIS